ncbi:hypothetical protein CRN76_09345 [Chryseobacterium indologenes]|uniref:hypothetical protein n=2 Tax=Chryseobacterium group TaxID=2782232 RepID=UPI000BFE75E5|nr:hypothetical protein [Chryseobacterium indologenes]ATN05591.1 hypothetical protein CRN76_09345 [Chryseobacterium indologenes]AYY85648.1 hypothetical protein EGX91_14385 [Chryseobacterium indologenes]QIX82549.1 hypothetical protein FOB56_15445 [Chryseobacterium indologenes]UDQ52198.1 hypothetical protein LJF28_12215 [Chryseobacterium indologenes]
MEKLLNTLMILCCLLCYKLCTAQSSPKYIEIEWKNGSEAAKKIMKSEFYYDPLDAWSPFGSDIGNDIYYLYCDWKRNSPNENLRKFMDRELLSSGYPTFDLHMDGKNPVALKAVVSAMRNNYIDLNTIDEKVISLAFTQLFLEGRIEPEVKKWAEAAFSREAVYLNFWGSGKDEMKERKEREERMNQLLSDLRKG